MSAHAPPGPPVTRRPISDGGSAPPARTSRPAARRSTPARAGCTSPRTRRRSAGTTGSSWTRRPGPTGSRRARCWCRPPASTASRRAACSPTSTRRRCRSASSRATRSTRARAVATAPRARRRSTRSPTPTGSCTPSSGPVSAARAAGSRSPGTRRSTTSPPGSERRSWPTGRTRSCTTWAAPARTASPSGCWPSWGVDGHNSHTNVCSSGARAGYHFWSGIDRPSPDHANADVILLISAHLETGHYFNPHAQRIMEAKARGAKLIVLDTRLSNTATHADHWLAPIPGSEAAIMLAIARHLIATKAYDREFVRRWWNWREYLAEQHPDAARRPSRASRRSWPSSTTSTPSDVRRPRVGDRRADDRRGRRDGGRRRHPAVHAQLALRRRRQPRRLAGRRARCSCSTRCSARSPPRAGSTRTPGPSSCLARLTCRATRTSGTSSPGRASTRWP